jgi:hypothetical protein
MAILPPLDEIQLDDDRPTLIILERPADKLPQDFVDWWNKQDLQNRVLVLTADPNAVTTLRLSARRMRAIAKVEERIRAQHGQGSPQMAELDGVRDREAANFTSALRETFKTIVFPLKRDALRRVDDFRMEFDRNDYSGEQQIIDTLTKRGKFIPSDQFDAKFDAIRLRIGSSARAGLDTARVLLNRLDVPLVPEDEVGDEDAPDDVAPPDPEEIALLREVERNLAAVVAGSDIDPKVQVVLH